MSNKTKAMQTPGGGGEPSQQAPSQGASEEVSNKYMLFGAIMSNLDSSTLSRNDIKDVIGLLASNYGLRTVPIGMSIARQGKKAGSGPPPRKGWKATTGGAELETRRQAAVTALKELPSTSDKSEAVGDLRSIEEEIKKFKSSGNG